MSNRNKSIVVFLSFILVLSVSFSLINCATVELTPTQNYAATRTTFNDIVEQYVDWAVLQPPEVKIKLREEVNPLIHEAEDALDLYYDAIKLSDDDPEARLNFYLSIKTKLINVIATYGLKIMEE